MLIPDLGSKGPLTWVPEVMIRVVFNTSNVSASTTRRISLPTPYGIHPGEDHC
jgi:hypothetical protein